MKKKIVIVGALGYLGTELCKLYSGESWSNKIIAIDSRFISERVTQLKDWNIEDCIQGAYDEIKNRVGVMENGTFVKFNETLN